MEQSIIENKTTYIIIEIAAFLIAIILSITGNMALAMNLLILITIIVSGVYFIYKFFQYKQIKMYEKHFPDFLRDLSESQAAGLTLIQSIRVVTKNNYGPLTKEVRKLNNQLSWNIPLDIALENFRKRIEKSKPISRSIMVISQARKSGGNLSEILKALTTNIEKLRDVENKKSSLLGQQVSMLYAIFFIFLGISIALVKFLVPLLEAELGGGEEMGMGLFQQSGGNPCVRCIGQTTVDCMSCSIFFHTAETFNFGELKEGKSYYKSLFFIMTLIQGFFTGLVAGQMKNDSVISGVKHSIIMVTLGFIAFIITNAINII